MPPIGGTYNATVYAKDNPPESNVNSSFAGYFDAWGKTSGLVVNTPTQIVASGISQVDGYKFNLSINFTNNGPATAWLVNLTVDDNPSGYIEYNDTFHECGNLTVNETCKWGLEATVLEKKAKVLETAIETNT